MHSSIGDVAAVTPHQPDERRYRDEGDNDGHDRAIGRDQRCRNRADHEHNEPSASSRSDAPFRAVPQRTLRGGARSVVGKDLRVAAQSISLRAKYVYSSAVVCARSFKFAPEPWPPSMTS